MVLSKKKRTEYFGERETSTYTFKHTQLKSYDEALKSVSKSDSKFLVVVFDTSKDAKNKFNSFLKNSEGEMALYMQNGYNSEYDNFYYYLASEKDKSILEKFKIKDNPTLVFLNSNAELVYHTKGTLEENSDKFNPYYSVVEELKSVNAKMRLDKVLNNKKATFAEIKKGFLDVSKAKGGLPSDDNYAVAADSTAVEIQEDYDTAAVDTTAAVAFDGTNDENYFHIMDRANLYAFKAKKIVVDQKWKNLVAFYTKDNLYDADFVEIAKRELIAKGFSAKLYEEKTANYEFDFKILEYLYKNYDQIIKIESEKQPIADDDMGIGIPNGADTIEMASFLSSFFSKRLSSSANFDATATNQYLKYNKMFLKIVGI